MATKFRKIGILTSGGDAPGMNAAIRAVTRAAIAQGVEVVGILEGYSGLINGKLRPLTARDVSNIINRGGTMLYSARCDEFKTEEGMAKAVETCRANQIDGIIAIGGDGTFRGATDLTAHGIPCIGIPGTIDNDIISTDYTIGYFTAVNTAIEMVDRLRDTSESHARCCVVEVMGRNSGYIALSTAIAVGATVAVCREIPFDEEAALQKMRDRKANGKRSFLSIVAEGVPNYGERLKGLIEEKVGIETKFIRLAHVVRGGDPTVRDRITATRMGVQAVDLLLAGESNKVICEQNNDIISMDIAKAFVLDRMYKGTLRVGDLDAYTDEEVAEMRARCKARQADIEHLYHTVDVTSH